MVVTELGQVFGAFSHTLSNQPSLVDTRMGMIAITDKPNKSFLPISTTAAPIIKQHEFTSSVLLQTLW